MQPIAMPALAPPLRPGEDVEEDILGDGVAGEVAAPPVAAEEEVVEVDAPLDLDVPEGSGVCVAGAMERVI